MKIKSLQALLAVSIYNALKSGNEEEIENLTCEKERNLNPDPMEEDLKKQFSKLEFNYPSLDEYNYEKGTAKISVSFYYNDETSKVLSDEHDLIREDGEWLVC